MRFKAILWSIAIIIVLATLVISPMQVRAVNCSISAVPYNNGASITNIPNQGTFDLKIRVNTDTPTRGGSFTVAWDPAKVVCNGAEEGAYFLNFASQNSGINLYWLPNNDPEFDNIEGRFPLNANPSGDTAAGVVVMGGATNIGPTGEGDFYVLHMQAKAGASGVVNFTFSNLSLSDCSDMAQELNPTGVNGSLTIDPPADSLAVTTAAATQVISSGATLNGNLTSLGNAASVDVCFEYGSTTAYGSTTQVQAKTATGAFSTELTGLSANATYHVRAKAVGATTVTGNDLTFTTAAPLTVTTSSANGVTASGATLEGSVMLGGESSVSVSFEWGTDTVYGNTTTAQVLTSGGAFSTALSGLTASTTYHFRAKAVGAANTIYGNDSNFTTLAAPVLAITTSDATAVTETAATLNGSISSLGPDTSVNVSFQYGTSTSYGSETSAQNKNSTGAYTAALSGLTPSTLYHFRAKAAGASTVYGLDKTFTTLTAAPTTTPPTTTAAPTTTAPPTTTPPTTTVAPTTTAPPTTTPAVVTGVRRATGRPTTTATVSPEPTPRATTSNNATASQTLDIAGSIDAAGLFLEEWSGVLNYGGKPINVEIKNGTRGLLSDGSPLTDIWIAAPTATPVTPENARFINFFELEPSGAIFSSPIQISLSYDAAQIAKGEDVSNITVVYFNPETGKWEDCDYTLDTQNRVIKANLSHFSLYGVILKNQPGMLGASTSVVGFGWSTAGTIILVELLIGCLVVYLLLRRKQQLIPATAGAAPMAYAQAAVEAPSIATSPSSGESGRVIWDDILQESKNRRVPFKTQLEIIGGKIIIPREGESADIELINMPDSRVLIALEYDPEVSPRGKAKIVVLGTSKIYEKSKELEK